MVRGAPSIGEGDPLMDAGRLSTLSIVGPARPAEPSLWIVGASALLGGALVRALEEHGQINVAGLFRDLTALARHQGDQPDVVLIVDGGHDAAYYAAIHALAPAARLVVTAEAASDDWLEAAGHVVDTVLPADVDAGDLPLFIELACRGYPLICSLLIERLVQRRDGASAGVAATVNALPEDEKKILACLVKGMSNKEIAIHIDSSVGSVKALLRVLMKKLNTDNRTKAAVIAVKNGFDADKYQ